MCQEKEEVVKRNERIQEEVKYVYTIIPKVQVEGEISIDDKVTNISKSIQGFHVMVVDLEERTTSSTPLEE